MGDNLNNVALELKIYLQEWYNKYVDGKSNVKLSAGEPFREFFKIHPEWKQYQRDIVWHYQRSKTKVQESDCKEYISGIKIETMDWDRANYLVHFNPKAD